jgi:hypothetical protein
MQYSISGVTGLGSGGSGSGGVGFGRLNSSQRIISSKIMIKIHKMDVV